LVVVAGSIFPSSTPITRGDRGEVASCFYSVHCKRLKLLCFAIRRHGLDFLTNVVQPPPEADQSAKQSELGFCEK
jgi:hypothetical protein